MEKLPENARVLQNLLAFFDPDRIEERLLTNPKAEFSDERLEFLADEFEYDISYLFASPLLTF